MSRVIEKVGTQGEFEKQPPLIPEEPLRIPLEGWFGKESLPTQTAGDQQVLNFVVGTAPTKITLPEHKHMLLYNTAGAAVNLRFNKANTLPVATWSLFQPGSSIFVFDEHSLTVFYLAVDAGTATIWITVW